MASRTMTTRRRAREPARAAEVPYLVVLGDGEPSRHALGGIARVTIGRGDAREAQRGAQELALAFADDRMSRAHATLERDGDDWVIRDSGSRNGTFVDGERCERAELDDGSVVELGHTTLLFRALDDDGLPADCTADRARVLPGVASFSPPLVRAFSGLGRVARSDVPILVRGETGTGKELVARAIHAASGRTGAFVAVNCGALPATLVESELFGYKKGAFSGAHQDRLGLARTADGGTLFLDEIGDLALASQAALLRLLQEREVQPLGAAHPVAVDLRVVSATHRDVRTAGETEFRRDLFARIAGYTLELSPLRARREDLGLIVRSLLDRISSERPLRVDIEAMRALVGHDWPLNVRELESCLRVAAALAEDGIIQIQHLPETVTAAVAPALTLTAEDQRRRDHLVALLELHGGNISAVARAAGKARVQIQRWLRRFQIDATAYKRS